MDHLEKQIQDFWENRTTPEQRREMLRELEGSGMEWKDFLLQHYHKVLAGTAAGELREDQKSRVWQRLQEQHLPQRSTRRISWLPWMAAASVLLVIGLCIHRTPTKPKAITTLSAQATPPKTIGTTNTGVTEQRLTLPDHSLVLLAPGSTIRYQQPFETDARNIQLEGRALFDVAKDSARPFTVTAKGFATTALGTKFIIDATRPVLSIRLLNGKIVVNATATAAMTLQKMYLAAGQELRINTLTKHFDRFTGNSNRPNPNLVKARPATALSFERTNLAIVFQRLSEYYKTPILYDKTQIQTLSFTGEFNSSDDLDLALKVICKMNQLTYTKESGRIVISKQQ